MVRLLHNDGRSTHYKVKSNMLYSTSESKATRVQFSEITILLFWENTVSVTQPALTRAKDIFVVI